MAELSLISFFILCHFPSVLSLEHTIAMCVSVHMWGLDSKMTPGGAQVRKTPPRLLDTLISKENLMAGICDIT